MKHPYILMSCVFALTVFSTLYDERTPEKPIAYRTISSVEVTKDGLCLENDSEWGKGPAPLTKESICKCHPDLCPQDESADENKSYPLEIKGGN